MPPNNKLEDIVQVALPYVQPAYKLEPQSDEPPVYYQASGSSQELADEEEEEPVLQVTTRARVTYELDRYSKNEMLIIKTSTTDIEVFFYILTAFRVQKFGITVIETDLSDENEIWHKIDQFFQKDFSNIGAVAVVTMISSQGRQASSRFCQIKEWDVLNYFKNNQPPTLDGRPKIFLSEALEPSDPPESLPMDTLLIQAKKDIPEDGQCPLKLLCYVLSAMSGKRELLHLVSESNEIASNENSTNEPLVTHISTMTKELLLEKEVNTEDYYWKAISEFLKDPDLQQIFRRGEGGCIDTLLFNVG